MDTNDTHKIAKIILIEDGKVLLLYSNRLKKYHLPGGHVQKNETFKQAVERELEEETGIKLSWCREISFKHNFTLFKGKPRSSNVKLSDEHTKYVWADIESADRFELCDFTKRDINGLQRVWAKRNQEKKLRKKPVDKSE